MGGAAKAPLIMSFSSRRAAKSHELPQPIHEGFVITDIIKKSWIIHKVIGSGGSETVYFTSDANKLKDLHYFIKVEYHGNVPPFTEMLCYEKIAKLVTE